MSKFHLAHIVTNNRNYHGLYGYKEVIETIAWGLEQLGHTVSYALNDVASDATNIIFGGQMLSSETQEQLPHDTIIYNLEQLRGLQQIRAEIVGYARKFRIWDYSEFNKPFWDSFGPKFPVSFVPIGFAPILKRIPKAPVQDIDVLIYGLPGNDRLNALYVLGLEGLTTIFVSGLYGSARDELIARSKLVLNINLHDHSRIFEVVRVSYLLANRKAVVALITPGTVIEPDFRSAVWMSSKAQLVKDCVALVANVAERARLEDVGFSAMEKRDIRRILESALEMTRT